MTPSLRGIARHAAHRAMASRRALLLLAAAPAAVLAVVTGTPQIARADPGPPQVTFVAPPSLIANGQPLRVTLSGRGMLGVTDVVLFPTVPGRQVEVISDSALVLTLPAAVKPGTYSVRLTSAAGSSAPGSGQFTVLPSPPPSTDNGPPLLPQFTFSPESTAPTETPPVAAATTAPAAGPGRRVFVAQVTSNSALQNPLFVLMVGIVVGGTMVVLWGRPGRMRVARRRNVFAHIVARPAQRLHLGRICLQCGKLHWIFHTRRDLWKAGKYCSATCYVAAQDAELSMQASEHVAPSRLREVTIYSELEEKLDRIFAAEAAQLGMPETLFGDLRTGTIPVNETLHSARKGDVDDEALVTPVPASRSTGGEPAPPPSARTR